ncbi:MAG: hypothetical protein II238_00605 [Alphaproteobacteria bacterium]|nr:hypothetical protein [Alphaproteobacteria bacterium]
MANIVWLKDANNEYSYARVVGFLSIIVNLVWRLYMGVGDIHTWPAAIVGCCGCITGVTLWAFEVWRENKKVSVKLGDKEYGAKLGE